MRIGVESLMPITETVSDKPLSNRQRKLLNLAVKLAETSEVQHRHGAVIVKGGRVISTGVNKWRNKQVNPQETPEYNPNLSYHAEVDAISHAGSDLNGATIYIARVNKHGHEQLSRPCVRCAKALKEAGIKKVVYTS